MHLTVLKGELIEQSHLSHVGELSIHVFKFISHFLIRPISLLYGTM